MPALMVQGCCSSAGKSYLVAGLCRLYARRGLKVAPFKAQNMSNNAGVTPAGLEMGRAQLLQAQAARVVPDVRMNPVLVKPEGETRSQVVVLGRRDEAVSKLPWTARKAALWPHVRASLHSLMAECDLVVVEGAGSPAEVNLKAGDIVNMRVALEAEAPVLLVADIDRGGAFAHLLGTWGCLDEAERALLAGFVLNKFRGDPALLGDGTAWLTARTGVPTLGVVPYRKLPLPEEDAHTLTAARAPKGAPVIAILRFPSVSNFDEFDPLLSEPGVAVRWVDRPEGLEGAAAVILPGSKHVAEDGAWLHGMGLAAAVREAAARVPVLGVCGGLQLLGHRLSDPHGVEGGEGVAGLGLLDVETVLAPDKTTRLSAATLLETGETVSGYEIHHGRTRAGPDAVPYLSDGLGYRQGNVTGVYLHGLFETTAFRRFFLQTLSVEASETDWGAHVERALDALADHLETHLEMEKIDEAAFGKRRLRQQGRLVLVTGGARSSKSRYAEALAAHYTGGGSALYLATLEAGDEEMAARIARHRERRPAHWRTVETPFGVADALRGADERVVLLDCLSGFVSNLLLEHEAAGEGAIDTILGEVEVLLSIAKASGKVVVVVTNEVGSGVVPAYALGRRFRDALGLANARAAAAADAVALTVVGLPQILKGHLPEVSLDS